MSVQARALYAGPGAWRALSDGQRGAVELVFGGGAYVRLGSSGWLLVTEPGAGFGPLSVAIDRLDRAALRPGAPARVTRGRLVLGEHAVSLERTRARPSLALWPVAKLAAAAVAADVVGAVLPTPPAVLRAGVAALADGRLNDAVRWLAGLGAGLTPAGDDVLAGYAAARHAQAAPVALSWRAASRSSALGLAYLRCAERGELPDVAARLLRALGRGRPADAVAALPGLRSWGSSSGEALALGINAAFIRANREE